MRFFQSIEIKENEISNFFFTYLKSEKLRLLINLKKIFPTQS
jgi:hypothetical protein